MLLFWLLKWEWESRDVYIVYMLLVKVGECLSKNINFMRIYGGGEGVVFIINRNNII